MRIPINGTRKGLTQLGGMPGALSVVRVQYVWEPREDPSWAFFWVSDLSALSISCILTLPHFNITMYPVLGMW